MQFDDANVDAGQLQDRRGMGGGAKMGMGAGGLGIVGLLLLLLLGGNPFESGSDPFGGSGLAPAQGPQDQAATDDNLAQRCNTQGAIEQYEDCFVLKVFNEVNEVWAEQSPGYQEPTLVFFEQGTSTACGFASSSTGPFYCPGDSAVYIDLTFLDELQRRLGAEGRYAQAYVVAHEVGHHLQRLTGTEEEVRRAQQADPRRANQLSVAMELQADCYAGVWGRLANDNGNVVISREEFEQAMNAAAAVGDDRIQESTIGRIDPESFTHGSAAARQEWFGTGFSSGDPNRCNTFG